MVRSESQTGHCLGVNRQVVRVLLVHGGPNGQGEVVIPTKGCFAFRVFPPQPEIMI